MTRLLWDQTGDKRFETGVDQGILFLATNGVYAIGYPWNGLTTVTESPDGAESNPQYADNISYLNLLSAETFGGTIEAFTYPDAFAQCDGTVQPYPGVTVGQQPRRPFGLAYRTKMGNDAGGVDLGYKWHLVYGALAQPSEKAFATVNDSPEALSFSWDFTTTPAPSALVTKPTSLITIDSTKVPAANMTSLENAIMGTAGSDPRLPLPDEVIGMFAGSVTVVTPTAPSYNSTTGVITVPTVAGVQYRRGDTNAVVANGSTVTVPVGQNLVIYAVPLQGYQFPQQVDDDFGFSH